MDLLSKITAARPFANIKLQRAIMSIALVLFAICGSIASTRTGLIIDDPTEQKTFRKITAAAGNLLRGDRDGFNELQSYDQRYYGIGFYAVAYPLQLLIEPALARIEKIDSETALLLARRPAVFLLFAVSVAVFYRCSRLVIQSRGTAAAFTAAYATCPYIFGHAMINIKDSPFMSLYLLSTYLSLRLVKQQATKTLVPWQFPIGLGVATAALASIRIPGLMILIQYLFTFLVADFARNRTGPRLIQVRNVLSFSVVLIPLLVLAYPALWRNPVVEFWNAMKFMAWLPQPGCTLTWGQCMPPIATVSYIGGWLIVKTPVIVLVGLALAPFAWKAIGKDPVKRVCYLTFLFGAFYAPFILIVTRSRLYDETRQILFIYPLLFLVAFTAMWSISRRIALVAAIASVAIFVGDQFQLHPYQYAYFNEGARFLNVDELFETDYWGTSGREHAPLLEQELLKMNGLSCLYADPTILYRPFIEPKICVESLNTAARPSSHRGIVAAFTCSPASRATIPPNCYELSEVSRILRPSNRKITMSLAYYCSP